jgi:hypothetical protein
MTRNTTKNGLLGPILNQEDNTLAKTATQMTVHRILMKVSINNDKSITPIL